MKKKLEIDNIKKMEDIFVEYLHFIPYSTQKRNIAYNIQHWNFMSNLYRNYSLYGSIKACFIQQMVITAHSICESLLHCVLRKEGLLGQSKNSFKKMINSAKKNKDNIISKDLYNELDKLNNKRDLLHPDKQTELNIKKFVAEEILLSYQVVIDLIKELEDYYFEKNKIEPPF